MSKSDITSSAKAFTDDLTLIAKNPEGCRQLISAVDDFLMDGDYEGKTSQVQITCNEEVWKQKQDSHKPPYRPYVAYDPQLEIDGKLLYISNVSR